MKWIEGVELLLLNNFSNRSGGLYISGATRINVISIHAVATPCDDPFKFEVGQMLTTITFELCYVGETQSIYVFGGYRLALIFEDTAHQEQHQCIILCQFIILLLEIFMISRIVVLA